MNPSEWSATLEHVVLKAGPLGVTGLELLSIVLLVALAAALSRGLRRALDRIGARGSAQNRPAFYALGRVAHYIIVALTAGISLAIAGVNLSSVALAAGALGVGVGLGLQQIVNNFVSGLILLFERTIKVGDFVQLENGLQGTVQSINVRSTVLTTNDNLDVVVPNSLFVNNVTTNWTLRDARRRLHVPFSVAYGTDKELVRRAATEAAARLEDVHSGQPRPEPQVWLVRLGDNGLEFELVVWLGSDAVSRPGNTRARYLWELETSLREHGIEIPFPQRDLHLRSGFAQVAPAAAAAPAVGGR